jgi:hypothetical protein
VVVTVSLLEWLLQPDGREGMTLPASERLVRFLTAVIGTVSGATRMGISSRRVLPSVRLRRSLRRRHRLPVGRWGGVVRCCVIALSQGEAGCSEKNTQRYASRQKTVHDTYTK